MTQEEHGVFFVLLWVQQAGNKSLEEQKSWEKNTRCCLKYSLHLSLEMTRFFLKKISVIEMKAEEWEI